MITHYAITHQFSSNLISLAKLFLLPSRVTQIPLCPLNLLLNKCTLALVIENKKVCVYLLVLHSLSGWYCEHLKFRVNIFPIFFKIDIYFGTQYVSNKHLEYLQWQCIDAGHFLDNGNKVGNKLDKPSPFGHPILIVLLHI